jgi:8-oxo-dGTP pyrophosphatase MutT (NUDIX family)
MKKEERHKAVAVLVSFVDDRPRFLTVRDRRHKEWIFITGGCRKREIGNPLYSALRELEEETRGVINLKRGVYSSFDFSVMSTERDESHVTLVYHVYVIEYNVPRFVQLALIRRFNIEKIKTDKRKKEHLPVKRCYDENDYMSFDTLDEFNSRTQWPFIVDNVLNNPEFIPALTSLNRHTFYIR